jgi:hypothetical protein
VFARAGLAPAEEVNEKWLGTRKGDEVAAIEVAAQGGCQLVDSGMAGVVVKISSHRPSGACVRLKDKLCCLGIIDSRLNVTEPSGTTDARRTPGSLPRPRVISGSAQRWPLASHLTAHLRAAWRAGVVMQTPFTRCMSEPPHTSQTLMMMSPGYVQD